MHQPAFPWLCCPKLFDALVCHGQACLAQGLLVLLWSGSPAPYIDCQLHSDLCPNHKLSSSCPLCQASIVLHCLALHYPSWQSSIALHCIRLHRCVNLYPDKSLCVPGGQDLICGKPLSGLIVDEKPHPGLFRPYWPKALLRHWTLKTPCWPRPIVGFTGKSVKRCLFKETPILV